MKKTFKLIVAAAILAVGFSSCGKDTKNPTNPEIKLVGNTMDATTDASNYIAIFTITCAPEAKLSEVTAQYFIKNGASVQNVEKSKITLAKTSDQFWSATITFPKMVGSDKVESIEVTAKTNDDGNLKLSYNTPTDSVTPNPNPETNLAAAANFSWKRSGSSAATGDLTLFGLKWPQNNTKADSYAYIEKNTATKFVKLTPAQWTSIKTVENLKTAIDGADDMSRWKEVNASATGETSYDVVLGVINGGTYYMLHVTKATSSSITGGGTTVEILGQYTK